MSPELPTATYRIQLHKGFTFDDAAALVPYLAALGVSHLYCSPFLQASEGSTHGYDVTDHTRLNVQLGGAEAYARLCAACEEHGLRQLVDIVPNHMAIGGRANRWWWDVLKNGRASTYAGFFDIDWDAHEGKLLLPVLGDDLGAVIERGELQPKGGAEPTLRYFEHEFPMRTDVSLDAGAPVRALADAQHYRLAYWREGDRTLNYRRFFDVKTLAGLRAEDPDVFDATHGLILDLVAENKVHGVRIDHIDGLRDPGAYLARLRRDLGERAILVEKILEADERLPESWPVQGTTGYEFATLVTSLLVDPGGEDVLTKTYVDFTGDDADPHEVDLACKCLVLEKTLHAEVARLARLFVGIGLIHSVALSEDAAIALLRETVAAFPVYRTYLDASGIFGRPRDRDYITHALRAVERHHSPEHIELLRRVLLHPDGEEELDFVLRFQQSTGPAMAKGFEDTFLYRFNRLVCLNDVGADPVLFGRSLTDFHAHNERVQRSHPSTLLATSTHDTKRSEDVRARIALLSEIPERWSDEVARWRAHNERHKIDGLPDSGAEYLLYQTLVGAYPLESDRAVAYMEKASKEAKLHTSWTEPDEDYDACLRTFTSAVVEDAEFMVQLRRFVETLLDAGWVNSLAMTVLKLTAPGVPDIYQGTEVWDLSLVDPDNRRPIDYGARRALVERIGDMSAAQAWDARSDGTAKLWLLKRTLQARREHPDAFGSSSIYTSLHATGARAEHAVAFARNDRVITVAPRWPLKLNGDWRGTTLELPAGKWSSALGDRVFAGGTVPLEDLLTPFPVALLTVQGGRT